jgi:regulator of nonsense transcripts 2
MIKLFLQQRYRLLVHTPLNRSSCSLLLLADRFCVNHGSNKNSRKRLYKTLFLVPHARLDLLPYWSRFAAILDRVYSDSTLVTDLEHQMHGQARFKKNQNIDSRLRTARYLSELTKFRVAPPSKYIH